MPSKERADQLQNLLKNGADSPLELFGKLNPHAARNLRRLHNEKCIITGLKDPECARCDVILARRKTLITVLCVSVCHSRHSRPPLHIHAIIILCRH
jgi:hypothetical protein